MNESGELIGILRQKSYYFRTLEKTHTELEETLHNLSKRRVLSPEEEIQKRTFQKKKLAAKDKMEEIIRYYKTTGKIDPKQG